MRRGGGVSSGRVSGGWLAPRPGGRVGRTPAAPTGVRWAMVPGTGPDTDTDTDTDTGTGRSTGPDTDTGTGGGSGHGRGYRPEGGTGALEGWSPRAGWACRAVNRFRGVMP